MKATSTLSTFLLLAGLYHTALAQQAQAPASSPDVASTSTLEQPPRPTLDTAAEWEKLVQQARVAVRLDYEAERAAEREQPASRPSGGDEKREGGIRIVRETVYLPYEGAQRGGEGGLGEAVIDGVSNAVLPSPPLVEEAPADIVRTVGKLRGTSSLALCIVLSAHLFFSQPSDPFSPTPSTTHSASSTATPSSRSSAPSSSSSLPFSPSSSTSSSPSSPQSKPSCPSSSPPSQP